MDIYLYTPPPIFLYVIVIRRRGNSIVASGNDTVIASAATGVVANFIFLSNFVWNVRAILK